MSCEPIIPLEDIAQAIISDYIDAITDAALNKINFMEEYGAEIELKIRDVYEEHYKETGEETYTRIKSFVTDAIHTAIDNANLSSKYVAVNGGNAKNLSLTGNLTMSESVKGDLCTALTPCVDTAIDNADLSSKYVAVNGGNAKDLSLTGNLTMSESVKGDLCTALDTCIKNAAIRVNAFHIEDDGIILQQSDGTEHRISINDLASYIHVEVPPFDPPVLDIPDASTTQKGIVQLSSATNSTSETLAATPKAVKTALDLARTTSRVTKTRTDTYPNTDSGHSNDTYTVDGLLITYPDGTIEQTFHLHSIVPSWFSLEMDLNGDRARKIKLNLWRHLPNKIFSVHVTPMCVGFEGAGKTYGSTAAVVSAGWSLWLDPQPSNDFVYIHITETPNEAPIDLYVVVRGY